MVCLCCTWDEEKQKAACILCHFQCGCFPVKCFDYDNDGMCWGCVCCELQIDPCFIPRQVTHLVCDCCPNGCCKRELCFMLFCCNPGKETADPKEKLKAGLEAERKAHPPADSV